MRRNTRRLFAIYVQYEILQMHLSIINVTRSNYVYLPFKLNSFNGYSLYGLLSSVANPKYTFADIQIFNGFEAIHLHVKASFLGWP